MSKAGTKGLGQRQGRGLRNAVGGVIITKGLGYREGRALRPDYNGRGRRGRDQRREGRGRKL